MKKFLITTALVTFAAGAVLAADAGGPVGAKRVPMQESPVPGGNYVAHIMRAEFEKGGVTNWHTHVGEEIGVGVSGQLTVQIQGQPDRIIKPGDSFRVPPNTPHNGIAGDQGYSGTGVYILDSTKPFATPVAKPQ